MTNKSITKLFSAAAITLMLAGCAGGNDTGNVKNETKTENTQKQEHGMKISDVIKNKIDFVAYASSEYVDGSEEVSQIFIYENGKMFTYDTVKSLGVVKITIDDLKGKSIDEVKNVIENKNNGTTSAGNYEITKDPAMYREPKVVSIEGAFGFPHIFESVIVSNDELKEGNSLDKKANIHPNPNLELIKSKTSKNYGIRVFKNPEKPLFGGNEHTPSGFIYNNPDDGNEDFIKLTFASPKGFDSHENYKLYFNKSDQLKNIEMEDYKKLEDGKTFFYNE